MLYNVYCDESCHLENDGIDKMVLGCIWVPASKVKEVSFQIRELKEKFGYPWETKWNRVSPGQLRMYSDLIDFFWDCEHLKFRSVVVSDKSKLDHETFNAGSHDAFYYKMFFQAFQTIIRRDHGFRIFLDIKDTRSARKILLLRDVLRSDFNDPSGEIIQNIQHIRSHESVLMQLCDLLIGAVAYSNRQLDTSPAKLELVRLLTERSGRPLNLTSPVDESKFNIFVFNPQP